MNLKNTARGVRLAAVLAGLYASGQLTPSSASAAILTGSVTTTVPSPENLTLDGPIDWALWDYQAATGGTTGAPSDRKIGGTSSISPVVAKSSGGTPRGITGTVPSPAYSYSDGTVTTNRAAAVAGAITDTGINVVGSGVQFTITGNPGQTEYAKVFVSGFDAVGKLTATLDGLNYTDSSVTYGATRFPAVYTLVFQPNSAADQLTIAYTISSLSGSGNGNADIQAIAVSNTPEPASLGLVAISTGLLLVRRRRRV